MFKNAETGVTKMHQNAPNHILNFKNLPRVISIPGTEPSAQDAESGVVRGGSVPSPEFFYYLTSKLEHVGEVFKLDLTEETRTQLQEEEAIVSSCLW